MKQTPLTDERPTARLIEEFSSSCIPLGLDSDDEERMRAFAMDYVGHVHTALCIAVRKQLDYGAGNIKQTGIYGIAVRLSDKVGRLLNLTRHDHHAAQVDESVGDTLFDSLNYSVFGLMLLNDEWGRWPQ